MILIQKKLPVVGIGGMGHALPPGFYLVPSSIMDHRHQFDCCGSVGHTSLSRKLNTQNEPFFISDTLLLSQGDLVAGQCLLWQDLLQFQNIICHPALGAGHPRYGHRTCGLKHSSL